MAAPANDLFANAQVITAPASITATNVDASFEYPDEPDGEGTLFWLGDPMANPMPATLWYKYVATGDGTIDVDTIGTVDLPGHGVNGSGDTELVVYRLDGSASFANLTFLGGSEDIDTSSPDGLDGGYQSQLTDIPVSNGDIIYIQVAGYNGGMGAIKLNLAADVVDPDAPAGPTPDEVAGFTTVTVSSSGFTVYGVPDPVAGFTSVRVVTTPDLSGNPQIEIGFDMSAEMELIDPNDPDPDIDPWYFGDPDAVLLGSVPASYHSPRRVMPYVSVSMPVPYIVDGVPTLPTWAVQSASTATFGGGSGAIVHHHAVAPQAGIRLGADVDVDPTAWWTVADLPDPGDGYYFLGDPSSTDGGIASHSAGWPANSTTAGAPSWHSYAPYKPTVRAYDVYQANGDVTHHPIGVHFNPEFVQHMWLDFGGTRAQPFTWVIAAMIVGYPSVHYRHYLLDAGRKPSAVGFPAQTADTLGDAQIIEDDLAYRTALTYSRDNQVISTAAELMGINHIRARTHANLRPAMIFGVFNAGSSLTGTYTAGNKLSAMGAVGSGASRTHRYYVLGRSQGWIAQSLASQMMVFELRYFRSALSLDELDDQYDQLCGAYQFDAYRSV